NNSTPRIQQLTLSGPCNNINFQTQVNTGNIVAGQQGSKNNANQIIKQSQSNTQNACTTTKIENQVIKNYIHSSPVVQKQISKSPTNGLIQLDIEQICIQIGDQACISANSNFKILFIQTTKDTFGNWILNGEAQNIASNPINNVRITWHLYDSQGNVIGLTQGFPIPSNLGTGQTTIFNLQERPLDLTGTPKFYSVSFDFLG
ncbi:MAG: FxLYD domain-containing protein, partial [Candidatus Nitrosocosmicus sp.]